MLKIPKRITIRVTYSLRCKFEEIEKYQSQPNISRLVRRALHCYAEKLATDQGHAEETQARKKSDGDTLPSSAIAGSSAKDRRQTKKAITTRKGA